MAEIILQPSSNTLPTPSTSTLDEKSNLINLTAPRKAGAYLDDDTAPPAVVVEEEREFYEEEEEDEEYWDSEDEQDQLVEQSLRGGLNEVMDQDWDVVSGGKYFCTI